MTTAVLPFAPHLLEATLHKVGKDSAVPIENSLDGLRNYLSALNIRNKCKHPLFLALRFDSCIGLLYDSTSVRNPAGDDDAFYMMMGAIGGDGGRGATSCGHSQTGFAPFVLAVKDHHHGDGVACKRTDCPIRLSAGITLPHHSGLPASYLMLCDQQVSALRKTYCRLYCKHVPSPYHTRVPVPSLAGVGTCVPSPGKLPVPPICHTCHSPHLGEPPSSEDQDLQAAQRYAKDMLATARQMGVTIATARKRRAVQAIADRLIAGSRDRLIAGSADREKWPRGTVGIGLIAILDRLIAGSADRGAFLNFLERGAQQMPRA
jgi:hypothetical protein